MSGQNWPNSHPHFAEFLHLACYSHIGPILVTGVGSGGAGGGGMCPPPTFESGGGGGKDMFVPPPHFQT